MRNESEYRMKSKIYSYLEGGRNIVLGENDQNGKLLIKFRALKKC